MKPMMDVAQVARWLTPSRLHGDGRTPVMRVHTDTRTLEPGDLFVAIKGERFDANALLREAQARGAVAAICHPDADRNGVSLACIEVPDTRQALGALAAAWRAQFDVPLIAVTGSNGKTTVTQMLASILRAWKGDAALATLGNFNNDIGVPLTLLRLRRQHQIAVLELGMNHPGEIAALAAMAQPTVALVNNAQREHLEFMATVQAVALENGSAIAALGAQGVAVFPRDDVFTATWKTLAGARNQVTFAMDESVGVAAHDALGCIAAQWVQGAWAVQAHGMGQELYYRLNIAGRHNVKNSLAAAAAALSAGVPAEAVVQGLQAFEPVKGRSKAFVVRLPGREVREITVVDDSYNANPDSVRAAIDVLADLPGPQLLVLGDMGEVGNQGPQFHAEAGSYAREKNIGKLLCTGVQCAHTAINFASGKHFDTIEALEAAVLAELPHVASILVKGSRFMRMERIVQAIGLAAQR
jgi:UDP-N-acetylmuramoyl-tripeptide--D-alanyl-D-alanine ligase